MDLQQSNFLVIESSFSQSDIALYEWGKIKIEKGIENQKHSDYLLHHLFDLLKKNGYIGGKKKLDAVVISSGPGSFTAIRVGVSIAKSIAFSFNIPLIAVSPLKALIQTTILNHKNFKDYPLYFSALVDARARELYGANYVFDGKEIKNQGEAILLSLDNLSNFLNQQLELKNKNHYLVGNFFKVYQNEFDKNLTNLTEKFSQIIELEKPSLQAMIDLALNTNQSEYKNAINFEIDYIKNNIADKNQILKNKQLGE